MNLAKIKRAAHCLQDGGIIAYPTEAVWGLGCDPWNEIAVMRLLGVKQRAVDKGLILVAATLEQIAPVYHCLDQDQQATLKKSWPGPYTWLVPDIENRIPYWIKGDHSSVAIRISAHPLVRELCLAFGAPVVSTSANITGRPALRSRVKVMTALHNKVDMVLPGSLGDSAQPSSIRDLSSGKTIR